MKSYKSRTEAWANRFAACWRCGARGAWVAGSLVIHHFCRGANRQADNLATTSILCQRCHDAEHNGDALGLLGCLRLKREHDAANYSLAEVCRVRGRAITSITAADIDAAGG